MSPNLLAGPAPHPGCPKNMHYGPCGGVGTDGSCEISPTPCVFLATPTVRWPAPEEPAPPAAVEGTTPAGAELLEIMRHRPLVMTGFPAAPLSSDSIARCAAALGGSVDAVLSGDSGRARVQFPPSYRAQLLGEHGLRAWMGFNCRDRNRVALEGELLALADAGAAGVHCVTGDHTFTGDRPDAMPVFDLESIEVVPLARAAGLTVSVAESPASPPLERRAARLAEKAKAGAQLCFPQYAGDRDDTARYIDEVRALGVTMPFVAGVPVVIDRVGAELLASFAAALLPSGFVDAVLDDPDPFTAGVRTSVAFARQLLDIDGVDGILAAGGAQPGQELEFARALAMIGQELGGGADAR